MTDSTPGLTYGFPIRSKRDENRLPQGFRDFELFSNFSADVLGSLRSTGLVSSPLPGIHEWIKDNNYQLIRSHLLCFPFAVVQLKPVEEQQIAVEQYICEAANAASAVLTLLDSLHERSGRAAVEKTPPVIAFTFAEPEIKLWLAYSYRGKNKGVHHRMVCIWASALDLTWGLIAMQQILRNMVFWATQVLRQISSLH